MRFEQCNIIINKNFSHRVVWLLRILAGIYSNSSSHKVKNVYVKLIKMER